MNTHEEGRAKKNNTKQASISEAKEREREKIKCTKTESAAAV